MLEVCMSVWPKTWSPALSPSGREGDPVSVSINDLISVSIPIDPRRLESLLEALAQVGFPVNPQIYHDAAMVCLYPDGREETETVTLVEFPAYRGQLDQVGRALGKGGFDPAGLQVTGMLDRIQSDCRPEPARRRRIMGRATGWSTRLKHRPQPVKATKIRISGTR
jgi:hypothetical protein